MEHDDEVQDHLHLSAEFLRSARRDVRDGLYAPARFSMLQALELALKAALMARTRTASESWVTHNVHGPFGRHFRGAVPEPDLARVSRLIQEYGKSRYPDWAAPSAARLEDDLAFIARVVKETVPRLVLEAGP